MIGLVQEGRHRVNYKRVAGPSVYSEVAIATGAEASTVVDGA
jgi:hypothetical protein